MSFDEPVRPDGAFTIGFIAALARECTSLRGQLPRAERWHVFQSGPGAAHAAAAASRAVDAGAGLLVSSCGGRTELVVLPQVGQLSERSAVARARSPRLTASPPPALA